MNETNHTEHLRRRQRVSTPTMGQVLRGRGFDEADASRFDHIRLPFALMPHQELGIHASLYHKALGLFFEPRTGKTIVMQMAAIYHAYGGLPTIFIMPGSLFYQFKSTFNEIEGHGLLIEEFNQLPAKRKKILEKWEAGKGRPHAVLMTREIFKKHWRDFYLMGYRHVVYDEAHQGLQSSNSRTSKEFRDYLSQNSENRLILSTGSPIPSRIENVWSTMQLLSPEAYRSQRAFESSHCLYAPITVPSRFGLRQIQRVVGYTNLDLLHTNLYRRAVYAAKREVLNLEEPNIQIISCELTKKHRELYTKVLKDLVFEIEKEDGSGESELIDLRNKQRLRHTALQLISTPQAYDPEIEQSSVFDVMDTLLQTVGVDRNKVLIFSNYTQTNEYLKKHLDIYRPALVYGRHSPEENASEVRRFRETDACRVLIANPQAGGVGFTLGDVCQSVIFVEPVSSPGIMDQAVSRVILKGQTEPVLVYLIRAEKTLSTAAIDIMLGRIPDIERVMGTKKSLFAALFKGEIEEGGVESLELEAA